MQVRRGAVFLPLILAVLAVLSTNIWTRGQDASFPFQVDVAASGLEVPWDLTFAPDGTLYFTERGGRVSRLVDGEVQVLATPEDFENLRVDGEAGLMGMALDPNFPDTPNIYLCHSYSGEEAAERIKVVRFSLSDGALEDRTALLEGIPSNSVHNGCRLAFGPDDRLYISVGDGGSAQDAQNPEQLNGKILRINFDGSLPEDNPYGNAVWTLGHRNPQGLVFHPETGRLYSTEHGPDQDDEVNLIEKGQNYGWPEVMGTDVPEPYTPALVAYTPPLAVAGLDVYTGELFTDWQGDLLFVSLRAGQMHRLELAEDGTVTDDHLLIDGRYGRLRAIAVSPSGEIFIATSNRDGRGDPVEDDDRILVLTPEG